MSGTDLGMMLGMGVLLCGSAFFSGSETALFSLSRHERQQLTRPSGGPAARALARLLGRTRAVLVTLLMGNMTINVSYFVLASVLLVRAERAGAPAWWLGVLSLGPLLVMILFGEVLPKMLANHGRVGWSAAVALPLLAVHRLLAPARALVGTGFVEPLARLLAPAPDRESLTADEMEQLTQASLDQRLIAPAEQRVLSQVLELGRMRVRELMVPRVDVVAYDLNEPADGLLELIRHRRLRHVPVYEGGPDHVAGVVHAREALLRRPANRQDIRKLIRQVSFVPEQQRCDRLLTQMRKTGNTFAIVVDEYGGTAGLITLEDLVEHVVGDIPGAFEADGTLEVQPVQPRRADGGVAYSVDAGLLLVDWPDRLADLPPPDPDQVAEELGIAAEELSTVAGLVLAAAGQLPKAGERVRVAGVTLEVLELDGRRIQRVLVSCRGSGRVDGSRPAIDADLKRVDTQATGEAP